MSPSAATQSAKLSATTAVVDDRAPTGNHSPSQSTHVLLSSTANAAAMPAPFVFPSTPSYRGEAASDTPTVIPLKRTELWAWSSTFRMQRKLMRVVANLSCLGQTGGGYCAYGWVSAVMSVPLLIQDVAAKNGVQSKDHSVPCDTTQPNYSCVMHVFGNYYLDPGTISLYISSLSAIVSFIVSLSIAAIADHGAYRKRLLVVFALLGCLTSCAYFIIQLPSLFWLAVILSPLGWACYNISSVFSNAFLPIYVRVHPKVLEITAKAATVPPQPPSLPLEHPTHTKKTPKDPESNSSSDSSSSNSSSNQAADIMSLVEANNAPSTPTTTATATTEPNVSAYSSAEQRKVEEQVSNDLSAWCAGAANVGALIVQGTCIGISLGMGNTLLSLQIAIAFTGVWWLVWTLAVLPWLDARPGPPLPKGHNWIVYSWSKNYQTFKAMRELSQLTRFIFSWFLLSDGVNTVIALFYVITYQELRFSHTKSLYMTMVLSAMAFVGAYLFMYIRQFWKLSTKFMIMLTLALYFILTAYFVVPTYFTTDFGLRHEWEAWVSLVYLGLIISTFYGVARVMMAELCLEGDENEWFSLFQLADKGSSWIGPFVTGAIQSATGEFRAGFWFPLALFAVGGALLMTVDVNRGKDEAILYKRHQRAKRALLASIPPIMVTRESGSIHNNSAQDFNEL
ncbi:Autophagy protein 22 [Mortierella alpina]|nr:Autophagy protein 22 [Mortierella alpina]